MVYAHYITAKGRGSARREAAGPLAQLREKQTYAVCAVQLQAHVYVT